MLVNEDEGRTENKDLCDRFCLCYQITESTRVTEKSKSLIDVISSRTLRYLRQVASWS